MATSNMHRKFRNVWISASLILYASGHIYRQKCSLQYSAPLLRRKKYHKCYCDNGNGNLFQPMSCECKTAFINKDLVPISHTTVF